MPKRKANKRYTPEFKEMIIRRIQEEGVSYNETEREYGIAHGMIQKWERIYLTEGPEMLYVERRGRGSKGRPQKLPKEVEEDLLKEVQRLRAENEYLKKLQALVMERKQSQLKK